MQELTCDDFDVLWPLVKSRAKEWITEKALVSARTRCNQGDAVCLMNDDGLVVVRLRPNPRDNQTFQAFIILAVSTGRLGAFRRQEALIVEMCREMGATELSFVAERKGWSKVLGSAWRANDEFYERGI